MIEKKMIIDFVYCLDKEKLEREKYKVFFIQLGEKKKITVNEIYL